MGKKILQVPYVCQEGQEVLVDKVFFLPPRIEGSGEKLLWDSLELFGNRRPIHIEYCSGNGEWIIDKALCYPEKNWVAVEKKFKRVRKIYSKREKRQIDNLVILAGEAALLTEHWIRSDSISGISINFPDPWPKNRHAKHRLIKTPFIKQLNRVIIAGGELTLVTDHIEYADQIKSVIEKHPSLKRIESSSEWTLEYGTSYFDRLWRSKGAPIHFLRYYKQKSE